MVHPHELEQQVFESDLEAAVFQQVLPELTKHEVKGFNAVSRAKAISFGVHNQVQDWIEKNKMQFDALTQGETV